MMHKSRRFNREDRVWKVNMHKPKPRRFNKGDRVCIVHGSFVCHLFGTFIDSCGTRKATVKVDGDIKEQRNLSRGSIRGIKKYDERVHGYCKARGIPNKSIPAENDVGSNDGCDALDGILNDLAEMKRRTGKIEDRVKSFKALLVTTLLA
jgi:hypothetical protein